MGWDIRDILRGAMNRGRINQARKGISVYHDPNEPLVNDPVTKLSKYGYGRDRTGFIETMRTTQLARTERFEVRFSLPSKLKTAFPKQEEKLTIMAEEVQIPGMVVENKEFNVGAWTHYRNKNMSFLGNEINITFYTDKNWEGRQVFEAWMAHCIDPTTKEVKFAADTWGEVAVIAMDLQDNYRKAWVLKECTPKVLNLQPMSMGAPGIVRTTLIISATYWESRQIEVQMSQPSSFPTKHPGLASHFRRSLDQTFAGQTAMSGKTGFTLGEDEEGNLSNVDVLGMNEHFKELAEVSDPIGEKEEEKKTSTPSDSNDKKENGVGETDEGGFWDWLWGGDDSSGSKDGQGDGVTDSTTDGGG